MEINVFKHYILFVKYLTNFNSNLFRNFYILKFVIKYVKSNKKTIILLYLL